MTYLFFICNCSFLTVFDFTQVYSFMVLASSYGIVIESSKQALVHESYAKYSFQEVALQISCLSLLVSISFSNPRNPLPQSLIHVHCLPRQL